MDIFEASIDKTDKRLAMILCLRLALLDWFKTGTWIADGLKASTNLTD